MDLDADEPPRSEPPAIERYRSYLILLAQERVGRNAAQKLDASDIVQQTLLKAHEAWRDFEGQHAGELAAWLRRILANTISSAMRDLRRARRNPAKERSLEAELADSSGRLASCIASEARGPASQAAAAEQLIRVADAVAALPEDQRTAILLKHCRAMSLADVAKQMRRSPASVASLLRRGLQRLRNMLGD